MAAPAATSRIFLALWPGPRTRAATIAWQDAHRWPAEARVTAPSKLHMTLHFLGAVPAGSVPSVAAGLAVPFRHFAFELDHVEIWPRGVVVLSPSRPGDELLALHACLADALLALRLPLEPREFRPHVTLARRASGAASAGPAPPPVEWGVEGYVLAVSENGNYRVLRQYGSR
ncbi:MAG: 2-5 ligase [Variovorax sp.]|nr:2-5 ligase [Variovorax sp.]